VGTAQSRAHGSTFGLNVEVLLTSREVAALLRISPSTLSRWRDQGSGPAWSSLNGIPRYEADKVASWVKDCAREHN